MVWWDERPIEITVANASPGDAHFDTEMVEGDVRKHCLTATVDLDCDYVRWGRR